MSPTLDENVAHPEIVTPELWRARRVAHLEREKALTREMDRLRAERRRLPMVKLDKSYVFDGPSGQVSLLELFEGARQLVVYHFMFAPEWQQGCPGCTGFVSEMGDLALLGKRNTRFVLISRAPFAKLDAYRAERGWRLPWYSSLGTGFNYDFHVTLDEQIAAVEYNYRNPGDHSQDPQASRGERPGFSVFFRLGDEVFHTYSTYGRGTESLTSSYALLDITPYGRQEDFEDSPPGWPKNATYV